MKLSFEEACCLTAWNIIVQYQKYGQEVTIELCLINYLQFVLTAPWTKM